MFPPKPPGSGWGAIAMLIANTRSCTRRTRSQWPIASIGGTPRAAARAGRDRKESAPRRSPTVGRQDADPYENARGLAASTAVRAHTAHSRCATNQTRLRPTPQRREPVFARLAPESTSAAEARTSRNALLQPETTNAWFDPPILD